MRRIGGRVMMAMLNYEEDRRFYHQPVKKLKPDYKLEPEVPAFDKKVPILFALEPKAPQQPSPEPIDPYEFSEDQPENVTQTGTPYSRNRGKEGKKGRGILQRRNSIRSNKQQDRKKQEDEQKKAEEERLKQEQQHQQQQQPQSQAPSSTGTAAPSDKNPLVNLKSPLSGLPLARHDPSASLMRETDLAVTANDLDQLFESSDDDECGGAFDSLSQKISMITADDSVMKPSSTHNKGSSLNSTNNGYLMTSSELARMFPTPPSLECNPGSAEYINPDSAPGSSLLDLPSAIPDLMEIEIEESLGSPKPEPIKDWSFVFKIPVMQRYFGSSMYAPLKSLPSSKLPPLKFPNNCLYKPSWQVGLSQKQDYLPPSKDLPSVSSVDTDMIKATQHPMLPLPSAGTPGVLQSPATFHATQEHHQNFESFSPASTPSSYVKNLNSIEPPTPANNIPEAHSLFVNLVLSDSLLNLFKDRNFDSCVICVCNMNIKGNDASLYLNDNQAQYKCVCGFSAIKNRRYGTGSGLFAEDEQDITGQQHDIALWAQNTDHMDPDPTRKAVNNTEEGNQSLTEGRRRVPDILVDVIKDQCSSPYGTLCQSDSVVLKHRSGNNSGQIARNQLELSDGCDACFSALELGRQLLDGSNNKLDDTMWKGTYLHSWAFTTVDVRSHLSSQDIVRILTTLRPILQDVVQRKRSSRSWEPPQFIVQGPLTWHTFFRTASRDKAESPEPLPVPSFLVGHDKDWLSLSPYALHYWDKLLLEPQCATHDVAYVVVTPDNDFILQCTKAFFKELGAVYETCRLGRHAPACTKVLRDGIMRVRKSVVKKIGDQPVDSWFSQFGSIPDAAKLKLYAQVCRHYLAPLLSTEPVDGSIFVTSKPEKSIHISSLMSGSNHSSSSGMGASGTVDSSHHSMPGSTSNLSSSAAHGDSHDGLSEPKESCKRAVVESDDDKIPPFVVVYLVDPFTYAKEYDDGCQAVFSTGLLRCFTEMLPTLPENLRKTISVQVVPLQHIIEMARKERSTTSLDKMKGLAFSVFTQCRRFMAPTLPNKSLTGFGPAADMELVLQTKEAQELQFKLYTPPYILAPLKDKQTELTETFGEAVQQCGELFVGYCLSHDQRWLLASCTDLRGEMMETCMINIDIPNSKRRKKVSQRKHAIRKLWDFILGVTATTALPWRLVIGRLGRLGHGEIKDWAVLLNRKTLLSRSRQLRDMCKTCNFTVNTADYPCIISACLVSMEPDPTIRMMADSVSMDRTGRSAFSQQNQTMLHSPGDATCTHIQVFPTSATTQVASSGYTTETVDPFGGANDSAMVDDLLFPETDLNDDDLDFFDFGPESPTHIGSPDPSQLSCTDGRAGSPSATQTGLQVNGDISSKSTSGQLLGADSEEAFILQQPLALGFYTSTTPTGPLPSWFWVSCPQAETSCPIFLKTALHVHTASVHQSDDNIMQHRHTHQLDSNLTTDVLRYVLENYNALSWLTVDPSTKDRRSCLPIHFVVLMQLYNTLSALL
ncbi:mediator of RNA polymerase II transcription subunit 13-like [Saccoglossus kowalevskii]|uniref:Mediator of RNA polymerase II transcription subunit 13 n=1 Tax=Saccoglossus kowalevskii TaxID=10224 RepID=A0ABM0GRD8_SACKO|nr:PREDICTED: mediator of RNA polymerase II transcription subunit 13-like [Saccoglossus kowalevskii]